MTRLSAITNRISDGLGVLGSVAIVLIMGAVVTDVIMRSVTGGSVPGLLEFSELLLASAVFLGLAAVESYDGHIKVTLVTERLSDRWARRARKGGLVITTLVLVLMAWAAIDAAIVSVADGESRWGLLEVPVWPGRLAVAVGVVMYAAQAAIHLFLTPEEGAEMAVVE